MNFILDLINLAAVEKTKGKTLIELQYCTGMSQGKYKNKIEKRSLLFIFFNFQKKMGLEGR